FPCPQATAGHETDTTRAGSAIYDSRIRKSRYVGRERLHSWAFAHDSRMIQRPPTADQRVPALPEPRKDRTLVRNCGCIARLVLRLEANDIVGNAVAIRVNV